MLIFFVSAAVCVTVNATDVYWAHIVLRELQLDEYTISQLLTTEVEYCATLDNSCNRPSYDGEPAGFTHSPCVLCNDAGRISLIWVFDLGLTGSIASTIGHLDALTSLWLFDNHLAGSVPTQMALLTNLNQLSVRANQLRGGVPSLHALTSLESCELGGVYFNGTGVFGNAAADENCWSTCNTQPSVCDDFYACPGPYSVCGGVRYW
jgi:hypothetical protein